MRAKRQVQARRGGSWRGPLRTGGEPRPHFQLAARLLGMTRKTKTPVAPRTRSRPAPALPDPDSVRYSDSETTLANLKARLARFVAEREWQKYHDPKNLAMSVAIEAAELMEHFQWLPSDELKSFVANTEKRREIADEMADVMCYLLSLANALNIDLADAVVTKLAKNERKYPAAEFRGRYEKR